MKSAGSLRSFGLGVLVLVAVIAIAAGCGGGGGSEDDDGATTAASTPAASTGESSGETTAPSEDVEVPAEITAAWPEGPATLDPDLAANTHAQNALHLIGGTLYEVNAEGELLPGLAESGEVSEDGLTWTFTLRDGLVFSDGTPLTSADVKATFDRARNDEANVLAGYWAPFESVEAPDEKTVVVTTSYPYHSLPEILSLPSTMVVPAAGLENPEEFFKAPISAGPYKLVSWDGKDNSTYVVNDSYWGPKPIVETVNLTVVADFNTRFAQLKTGQIDFSIDFPPSMLPQLEAASAEGVETHLVPTYGWMSLDMWNGKPPLDDVNVRKAISLAIDRDQINDVIWNGGIETMAGFWPPTMEGYDPSISATRDVEQAKMLLAGTECATGCTLTLEYATAYSFADQAAAIMQSNLAEIGIDLKLVKLDLQTFFDNHNKGAYQLGIGGLISSVNIPDLMLGYAFPLEGGGGLQANWSGWSNPDAIAVARKAIETPRDQRGPVLDEINDIYVADMPYATLGPYMLLTGQRYPTSIMSVGPSAKIEIAREPS